MIDGLARGVFNREWTPINANQIAAKELEVRKDYSLSASIGERVAAGRESVESGRSTISYQPSTPPLTADGRRWTQMKIPAKELKGRKEFSLSASSAPDLIPPKSAGLN